MEIRFYRYELDYCNIIPEDELGITISEKDITFLFLTYGIGDKIFCDEIDFENGELICYCSRVR